MSQIEKELTETIRNLLETFDGLINDSSGTRKSIFDIAGIKTRENINSNILQFFLLQEEQHGFGSVFFDCLCELIEEKLTEKENEDNKNEDVQLKKRHELNLDSDFEVIREYQDIDLLIASKSSDASQRSDVFNWAILIEHKIYHKLDNPLLDYWNRVHVIEGGVKVGIVLSPWGQKDQSLLRIEEKQADGSVKHIIDYLDINHREWANKVRDNIPHFYLTADNYSLNLLKDFLNNIESMYMSHDERQLQEIQINVLQENLSAVNKIMKLDQDARKYILSESIKVMEEFNFESNNNYYSSTGKDFSPTKDGKYEEKEIPNYFKFYIWYPSFIEDHELNLHFYLDDKFVKYAKKLREHKSITEAVNNIHCATIDSNKTNHLIHIKDVSFENFSADHLFYNHLKNRMVDLFFKEKSGLLWICKKTLEEIEKTEMENIK